MTSSVSILSKAVSRKVIVVGAVAGGASCAARLRRLDEHAQIVLFEKGPDPSFANCGMPYFIGGEILDRHKLSVQTPASLKAKLNLDVRVLTEVLSIDTVAKTVSVRDASGREYSEGFDELVLSLGAKPFLPPIPGIDRAGNLSLRNLDDMDRIVHWVAGIGSGGATPAKTAVIAGGGFIGIEMAEQLHRKGLHVTIVEALPQLLAPFDPEIASMLQHELEKKGVRVVLNSPIKAFEDSSSIPRGSDVILADGSRIPAEVVILGLGVRADTALAKAAGLKLSARGGILVDERLATSAPHVWAVGDAIEVRNPIVGGEWMVALAGPANRQGRVCADNIAGKARAYKGTWGSSAVRVFGVTAAGTGLNERGLKLANTQFAAVHLHPSSHASYYPGAHTVSLKILFKIGGEDEGKLLGAQAVGEDGADKVIDTLATALQAGMTVFDLAELELCYAPPVGSAKSPVNHAGFIACNMLEALVSTVRWHELPALAADPNVLVVDVRDADEVAKVTLLDTALNVPLGELRARLGELPRDKAIVTSCASGQRGYYAARILMQNGFVNVRNLDGAVKTLGESPLTQHPRQH